MNLNQITLPVSNIKEANSFYLKLGFTQIVDSPHYSRFKCPDGESTFSLPLNTNQYSNHSAVYFEHEELDVLVSHLKSKGIKFDKEPKTENYLWREAILRDPSNNKIILYWAGENRINPPWRVNINSN